MSRLAISGFRVVQRYYVDEDGAEHFTTYELQWQDDAYGDWHRVPVVYEEEDAP